MTTGPACGFVHPVTQGRDRQGALARLPLLLWFGGVATMYEGTQTALSPWLLAGGGTLLAVAAVMMFRRQWTVWRRQWRADREELHRLHRGRRNGPSL